MPDLRALDLSKNKIATIPKGLTAELIALDLSHNSLKNLSGMSKVRNLIEIRLSHNVIESLKGFSNIPHLQHLDVSYNSISIIEGIETLTELETLNLGNNSIKYLVNIRCLTFNKALHDLNLSGNTVNQHPKYKFEVTEMLPSLEVLDGTMIRKHRLQAHAAAYGERSEGESAKSVAKTILIFTGSRDCKESHDDTEDEIEVSSIPWRNPPKTVPRSCSWRGKHIEVGHKGPKPFHYADGDFVFETRNNRQNSINSSSKTGKWKSPENVFKSEESSKKVKAKFERAQEYDPDKMSLRPVYPKYISGGTDEVSDIHNNSTIASIDYNDQEASPRSFSSCGDEVEKIPIILRLHSGKNTVVSIDANETVDSLKQIIEDRFRLPKEQQILKFSQHTLDFDRNRLVSYGILANSVIVVMRSESKSREDKKKEIEDKIRLLATRFPDEFERSSMSPQSPSSIRFKDVEYEDDDGDERRYHDGYTPRSPLTLGSTEFVPVTPNGKAIADALKTLMEKKRKTLEDIQIARSQAGGRRTSDGAGGV